MLSQPIVVENSQYGNTAYRGHRGRLGVKEIGIMMYTLKLVFSGS